MKTPQDMPNKLTLEGIMERARVKYGSFDFSRTINREGLDRLEDFITTEITSLLQGLVSEIGEEYKVITESQSTERQNIDIDYNIALRRAQAIINAVLIDSKVNEKNEYLECNTCHKKSVDVNERPNAYANDVGNDPYATHIVCDSCDYENRMDI